MAKVGNTGISDYIFSSKSYLCPKHVQIYVNDLQLNLEPQMLDHLWLKWNRNQERANVKRLTNSWRKGSILKPHYWNPKARVPSRCRLHCLPFLPLVWQWGSCFYFPAKEIWSQFSVGCYWKLFIWLRMATFAKSGSMTTFWTCRGKSYSLFWGNPDKSWVSFCKKFRIRYISMLASNPIMQKLAEIFSRVKCIFTKL